MAMAEECHMLGFGIIKNPASLADKNRKKRPEQIEQKGGKLVENILGFMA